jgi:uncharacterized Zn finger protein
MAKAQPVAGAPTAPDRTGDPAWAALTWGDLEGWAGSRSVARGRTYQRGGRVKDLRITADGRLLATVTGGARYATTASLTGAKTGSPLGAACSCPIGGNCKHAVAVVAEYLDALANARPVPPAAPDDPRWATLEAAATGIRSAVTDGYARDEDESHDEHDEGDPGGEDDDKELTADQLDRVRRAARAARGQTRAAGTSWDDKIERHIRAKSPAELADLAWLLTKRFPEVYREFRERIALQEGDAGQLVEEARREIRKVTAESGWQNRWSDGGHTPDYSRIRHRLVRLLESGRADEVVALGRELIAGGLKQVGQSDDEGETAAALAACLPTVFQAVTRSRLAPPERLLFAIDAELADDYDVVGDAGAVVLDAPASAEDWSAVADALTARVRALPAPERGEYSFSRDYARDRLTGWVAAALAHAGRDGELGALYEAEARATNSYERLVAFLFDRNRAEEAERWAREGIAATGAKSPGIAAHLAERLRERAAARKRWDEVAAHAALKFFESPGARAFDELMKAARKAEVEEAVGAAARRFLETGVKPFRVPAPPPAPPPPRTRLAGRRKAVAPPPAPPQPAAPAAVTVDPAWPLPLPEYLVPLLKPRGPYDPEPRPRLDVLLDMAIAADRPDEVLHWFDRMRAGAGHDRWTGYASSYADRVAAAVSRTHPERAIEVYRVGLDAQLPNANQSAYQNSAGYLRKLRPLYAALDRSGEWTALVASIRERYKARRLFMELLDGLEGHTIIQTVRKPKK